MAKQIHATADREADQQDVGRGEERAAGNRGGSPPRKKDRQMTTGMHWFFESSLYKRNQGRITRQATAGGFLAGLAFGCWQLSRIFMDSGAQLQFGVPLLIMAIGAWAIYRVVNYPKFADFLIAVEAEMAKVSWPTWSELVRSSIVVIIVIVGLAIMLFGYDYFWNLIFKYVFRIGV
jgi:preprotein translocase subunit SecE